MFVSDNDLVTKKKKKKETRKSLENLYGKIELYAYEKLTSTRMPPSSQQLGKIVKVAGTFTFKQCNSIFSGWHELQALAILPSPYFFFYCQITSFPTGCGTGDSGTLP